MGEYEKKKTQVLLSFTWKIVLFPWSSHPNMEMGAELLCLLLTDAQKCFPSPGLVLSSAAASED